MRNALARTLYELVREDASLGRTYGRVIVLVADISPAGAMDDLRHEFPDAFINVGVAEQAMIGLAAGLAQRGFRPFCYTIAPFALFRPYEFIRCDLAYQDLPVTVVGMGAGLSYPTLGGTHQAIEDVALALACPNLAVLAPCDQAETMACARWCARRERTGPVYLRIGKSGEPDLTSSLIEAWNFGQLRWLRKGSSDKCVITYGPIAASALRAGERTGADVVLLSTLSEAASAIEQLKDYKKLVVVEEASGAPLAAALALASNRLDNPPAIVPLALDRKFVHGFGTREQLLAAAGLSEDNIALWIEKG